MAFSDWISETADRIASDPIGGTVDSLYELYIGGLRRTNVLYPGGQNVFEREWDVLIILDACRPDLLKEVVDEYPPLNEQGTLTSVGSSSIEWMEHTFTDDYTEVMKNTAYVTGNPFSKRMLAPDDLLLLDEVWRYGWDDEVGTIPARSVTDRAITAGRECDYDRLIVHYMQPHFPSVPDPLTDGMNTKTLGDGEGWDSPWHLLRQGEIEYETLWSSYRKNLHYVLKDVELLLDNLDAEHVVISADHGNAAGEWGVYGHPKIPLRSIRTVPWYETSAADTGSYVPERERGTEVGEIEEKLDALGYL